MNWTVSEVAGSPYRTLVCEAENLEDLSALRAKAELKGWSLLAEGSVPGTSRLGVWLTKPAETPTSINSSGA